MKKSEFMLKIGTGLVGHFGDIKVSFNPNQKRDVKISDFAKNAFHIKGKDYYKSFRIGPVKCQVPKELFDLIIKTYGDNEIITYGNYPYEQVNDETAKLLEDNLFTDLDENLVFMLGEVVPLVYDCYYPNLSIKDPEYAYSISLGEEHFDAFEYNGELYYRGRKHHIWYKGKPILWKVNKEECSLETTEELIPGDGFVYLENPSENRLNVITTENYVQSQLDSIIFNSKINSIIEYRDFNELCELIEIDKIIAWLEAEKITSELAKYYTVSKRHASYSKMINLVFKGPHLNKQQRKKISKIIKNKTGNNTTINFENVEELEDEFDKNKFKDIKRQEDASLNEIREKYNEIIKLIERLKTAVASLEDSKDYSKQLLESLRSSILVPNELLIVKVDDHFEFNPEFIDLLPYINLSLVDGKNLKLSNLNLGETNIHFDPQEIYKRDLENSTISDFNVEWGSFEGVNLKGADVSRELESAGFDKAIIDENTKLPNISKKEM